MTPEIFRQRYPQGGLISELAAIEHGQFIVRVMVVLDGVTLASGLAAAPSVEQAEDQARIRALNLFGLGTHPVSLPVVPSTAIAPPAPKPQPHPIAPPPAPTPIPTPQVPEPQFKLEMPLSAPPEPDELDLPELPLVEVPQSSTVTGMTESETLDFSEIIARTDVELKRLNWSSEQGRNYLLETYGKRSRQLLSDEELFEFLTYLKTQPSP